MTLKDLTPEIREALVVALEGAALDSMSLLGRVLDLLLDLELLTLDFDESGEVVERIRLTPAGRLVAELLKENAEKGAKAETREGTIRRQKDELISRRETIETLRAELEESKKENGEYEYLFELIQKSDGRLKEMFPHPDPRPISGSFVEQMRRLREKASMSQEDAAFVGGVDHTYISHIEADRKLPKVDLFFRLLADYKPKPRELEALIDSNWIDRNEDSRAQLNAMGIRDGV